MSHSTNPDMRKPDGLLLPGLDGSNPLGFLAALGIFKILDEGRGPATIRMNWKPFGGTWVPVVHVSGDMKIDENALLVELTNRLATTLDIHPARFIEDLEAISDDDEKRRKLFKDVVANEDRMQMDWAAALASDFAAPNAINQLQTTRRDYFYQNLKSVISRTTPDHLHRAIFLPWDYTDALDNQSLHLDPSEDRRHAHQWNQPAGDPDRKNRGGMLGANRLALEAIPLFTSFPEANALRTVGFTGSRSTNTRWTWPIWKARLSLPVARSLLASARLQSESFETDDLCTLKELGVSAIYRTRRILVGKTPNFTPAQCLASLAPAERSRSQ